MRVLHKRSATLDNNGDAKRPSATEMVGGELAVNYAGGKERLFLKNTDNGMAEFVPLPYIQDNFQPAIKVENSESYSIRPNVYHNFGNVGSATFTLSPPEDPDIYNEYMGKFTVNSDNPSISFPSDIKWAGILKYRNGNIYEFSIVDGLGVMVSYS